ncbi:MAG TPA: phosphoenolpyruvate kinase [Thermoanaerobaculia bacterium]|nr:phosphoenolpyruvate kinase [Thermoanaerobaculia bacterium]
MTTLSQDAAAAIAARLQKANAEIARRYPGDSPRRQPVHTVYGGAQVFKSDSAPKLGALALRSLENFAPDAATFGSAIGLPEGLAPVVMARVREKLEREAVEDFRVDFEDGYGNRPDAEEDGHAVSAAREMAAGMAAKTLPPYIGIRIKPFTEELKARSIRTLDLFLTELATQTAGRLPQNFVVTLPKITSPDQVAALADLFELLEKGLNLSPGSLALEIMVETPQSIIDEHGQIALLPLVVASRGRCVAAHFGTYDYTASLNITAAHQHMTHPACDFARHMMQVALAGTGVWISDGATNVLPVAPHRTDRTLTGREISENRAAVHSAWKLHYGHVRHSLEHAYYQGWDLHPAQFPTRYAALYAFFLEGLDAASARLTNFVAKAGQATLMGEVFDDAATGQGLLNYFLRAWNCGAITEQEAIARSGLTLDELRSRSFVKILKSRRA